MTDGAAFDLTDKVAIVTGGGTGIGEGIAKELARAGAHVVLASRKLENLERVAGEIRSLGKKTLAVATDVSNPEAVNELVRQTLNEFGRIDVLVNNSGLNFQGPAEDVSLKTWNAVIGVDLTGTFLCCQAVARAAMIPQKRGKIINISSTAGRDGSPMRAPYSAAKAAVNNLTKSLGLEWARYGINVNCIAPGPIETEGLTKVLRDAGMTETASKYTALGRWGQTWEIGYAAVFLASAASDFITGETLYVDGGLRVH